jgi:two-component system OmpR family response regulator
MKMLLIEDDTKISEFVAKGLQQAGFDVDVAHDGETGLELAMKHNYELLILDLMLPRLDGLSLVEKLRAKGVPSKVLILSAKRSVDERVLGLQKGGDDYLTKPFAFSELLARCQALARRASVAAPISHLKFEDISLDLLTREVYRSSKKIDLQTKEFALLEYFMRSPGIVISKTQILERIWNYNFDPQTNVVDVLVCRLRNKIDKDFPLKVIHTIRGIGYVCKIEY